MPLADALGRFLNLAPGDRVLLAFDPSHEGLTDAVKEQLTGGGFQVELAAVSAEGLAADKIVEAVGRAAAALLATAPPRDPPPALREAARRQGTRLVRMGGFSWDMVERVLDVDGETLARRVAALGDLFRGGRSVEIETDSGGRLRFAVSRSVPELETGDYRAKGSIGDLPAGHVLLSPVSETVEGELRAAPVFVRGARVAGSVTLRFAAGCAAVARGGTALRDLEGDGARVEAVGFGANPWALPSGHPIEDLKVAGRAWVRLAGGVHALFTPKTVLLDKAALELPQPPPPPPAPEDVSGLYGLMLENSLDAQYAIDVEARRFLYVNRAFEQLVGYTLEELLARRISPDRLITPEERGVVIDRSVREPRAKDRYAFVAVTREGRRIHVEASIRRILHQGRRLAIGVAREVTEQKRIEKKLREEVDLQRHQTLGAYQANVRIYQLTEKIRAAYESTQNILKCRSLDEMARAVIEVLCAPEGLNYKSARFYHVDGRWLRRLAASDEKNRKVIDLRKNHRLARLVRGEIAPGDVADCQVVPLRLRDATLGLLALEANPDEKARVWQDNIVMTLASLIALMIDNLALYDQVKAQTVIDPLTRVFNRRHLDEKLAGEVRRAVRYKRALSLAMIDIDDFKKINDTYGHPQGDVVLRDVAKILSSWTRSTDIVFRFGGEEFALVLPETAIENAHAKVEGLRSLVESTPFANLAEPDRPLRVTVSAGLAEIGPNVQTPESLVQAADQALYASKRSGKNRITVAARGA